MKNNTIGKFTWAQLDQRLRVIAKSHNGHPPYTPTLLRQGTRGLQNFDGTQLQVQVTAIRSCLPSQSPEIIGQIGNKPGIKIFLSSTSMTSQRTLGTSSQIDDQVTAPSPSSSPAVICLDTIRKNDENPYRYCIHHALYVPEDLCQCSAPQDATAANRTEVLSRLRPDRRALQPGHHEPGWVREYGAVAADPPRIWGVERLRTNRPRRAP
ncbi:hypothetical protein PG994_004395 [Apiospora phragmitis]|uniref:Uncharacterized protein n=1 Tax=Apiospora phragmitis TaxID=2905665 RepID=A0ABR1VQH3_9PEZI